mgnify:CR=1 FL=1
MRAKFKSSQWVRLFCILGQSTMCQMDSQGRGAFVLRG